MKKISLVFFLFFLVSCQTTKVIYLKPKPYPFEFIETIKEDPKKDLKTIIEDYKRVVGFYVNQIKRYNESRKNEHRTDKR